MSKAKDLRDLSSEELENSCQEARKELFQLVNENKMNKKTEKPHLIREKKKEIARMLTIMHEKQFAS
ncbi:50S ribosomal protein L29 [Candidatus Rubidus massiliensis]|nr:MAG: 50S ribosomal protein L29 [Chlamydia sp. 32-24]CDZ80470.1 50S ribosomal protein L29 [Candidatus Rubidus massiliensis]